MEYIFSIFTGYLLGTINISFIIGKMKGFDIRKMGSKNAGASNAVILLGKATGVFCALFDIGKVCIAIWIIQKIFPGFEAGLAITGAAGILGHIFPFYMNFRGGKGLACLGGAVLMFSRPFFLILLTIEIVVLFVTKYICFVPLTASVIMTIVYAVFTKNIAGTVAMTIATVAIIYKHKINIKRIKNGTEMRISYLWNRENELERISEDDQE